MENVKFARTHKKYFDIMIGHYAKKKNRYKVVYVQALQYEQSEAGDIVKTNHSPAGTKRWKGRSVSQMTE